MKYNEFIDTVAERAGVPGDRAAALATATLTTLAERISADEAHDLASELPKTFQGPLRRPPGAAEAFGLDEFVRRVAQRAGIDAAEARRGARAVLTTVREAVSGGEFRDLMAQLPPGFEDLVEMTVPRRARAARR
jgi:uncharacterized protein (DUF2267 family)